ncbi:TM2 domain-containing protein [Phytohabitans rumicis]|uniref:TM2 domain-containing protein n=1 Tax=Phytohabitans rumicis TaxID=1076125 RepID=UPI001C49A8E1|nr:TM2 domain-containing protein [Phytohabitans rumicis]
MSTTVAAPEKSVGTAYLLWFFLGAVGAHQFYLGKTGRAISYIFTLGWLGIGLLIDLFTLPKQVRAVNGTPAA